MFSHAQAELHYHFQEHSGHMKQEGLEEQELVDRPGGKGGQERRDTGGGLGGRRN